MNHASTRGTRFSLAFLLLIVFAVCICLSGYRWFTQDLDQAAYEAVVIGDVAAVQRVVRSRPDLLSDNRRHSPKVIVIAAMKHDAVLDLVAPSLHQHVSDKATLWSALAMAVRSADTQTVRTLLDSGWDPNAGATHSLLLDAYRHGSDEIVDLLFTHNAERGPALAWACGTGQSAIARRLLDAGADPSVPGALAGAIKTQQWELTEQLIAAGANTADGLVGITNETSSELIARLLDSAEFDFEPARRTALFRNLFVLEDASVLDAVSAQLEPPPRAIVELVSLGAARKPLEKLEILLRHAADPNEIDGGRGSALHIVIATALFPDATRIELAQRLIDAGADINLNNRAQPFFLSPLELCFGHYDADGPTEAQFQIAKRLLAAGVETSREEGHGPFPLLMAAVGRYRLANRRLLDLVPLLIDAVGDVNLQGHGYTLLGTAAAAGQVELVELLLASGADREMENERGETPLQRCHRKIREGKARYLSPNEPRIERWTEIARILEGSD